MLLLQDELYGVTVREREDGLFERVPVTLVPVERLARLPVRRASTPLSAEAMKEFVLEADEVYCQRKELERTFNGRAILEGFYTRLSKARRDMLPFACVLDVGLWLHATGDEDCAKAANKYYAEWDDLISGAHLRRDRGYIGGSDSSATVDRDAAHCRWKVHVCRSRGLTRAVRNAQFACDTLKASHITRQEAVDGLKRIAESVQAEAEEFGNEEVWKWLAGPHTIGYADFKAGGSVHPDFEKATSLNWDGRL